MAALPKLKIKLSPQYPAEDAFDLEQAKSRLNFSSGMVVVEGRIIYSYDELLKLASQEAYRNREYLEVEGVATIAGG